MDEIVPLQSLYIYTPRQKYKNTLKNEEKDSLQFLNYENKIYER